LIPNWGPLGRTGVVIVEETRARTSPHAAGPGLGRERESDRCSSASRSVLRNVRKLNRCMGAKRLVLHGAIINVLGTFATPAVATYLGTVPMVVLRFVMGFGQ
ncbi:hypothetical protein ANCDUO_25737, partial [Ancylostoma duodenale]